MRDAIDALTRNATQNPDAWTYAALKDLIEQAEKVGGIPEIRLGMLERLLEQKYIAENN